MYSALYIFHVPERHLQEFVSLQSQAASIYAEHGAIGSSTYQATDLRANYDCEAFDHVVDSGGDVLLVGLDVFEDEHACRRAMNAIKNDDRMGPLGAQFEALLASGGVRAHRGEFTTVG